MPTRKLDPYTLGVIARRCRKLSRVEERQVGDAEWGAYHRGRAGILIAVARDAEQRRRALTKQPRKPTKTRKR